MPKIFDRLAIDDFAHASPSHARRDARERIRRSTPADREAVQAWIAEDSDFHVRVNRLHACLVARTGSRALSASAPPPACAPSRVMIRVNPLWVRHSVSASRTMEPVIKRNDSTNTLHLKLAQFQRQRSGGACSRALLTASLLPIAALVASPPCAAVASTEFSDTPLQTAPPVAKQAPAPRTDGLAETLFDAELLGFTMRVPIGSSVRMERTPTVSYLLAGEGETPAWRMRVSSLTASKADSTAASQCEEYLAQLRSKGQKFDVLRDEAQLIAGAAAHIFYIRVALDGGGAGVTGTLIIPRGNDTYLVYSLVLLDADYARVAPLLDRAFATITLKDERKVAQERLDLLGRGTALTKVITAEALRATIAPDPAFYRMRKPDSEGELIDFGYMSVRVREGKRGEIDASRAVATLKGDEADLGLLATVDARVVVNNDPTHTLDVQSRYFVSWDRGSECWSIRSTQRHKRATRSNAQTGVRAVPSASEPKPALKVISATADGLTRTPQEWPLPPAYISQAELIVLGQLLPHDLHAFGLALFGSEVESIEFLDYAFDQREEKLPQRRESWSRTKDGFKLETSFGSSPAKLVQEFDAKGKRVRRSDPDGTLTELIALDELRRIWKSKGLPVD